MRRKKILRKRPLPVPYILHLPRRLLMEYYYKSGSWYYFKIVMQSQWGAAFAMGSDGSQMLKKDIMDICFAPPDNGDNMPILDCLRMSKRFRKLLGITQEGAKNDWAALPRTALPSEDDDGGENEFGPMGWSCWREGDGEDDPWENEEEETYLRPSFGLERLELSSAIEIDNIGTRNVWVGSREGHKATVVDQGPGGVMYIYTKHRSSYESDDEYRQDQPQMKIGSNGLESFLMGVWFYNQMFSENLLQLEDVFITGVPTQMRGTLAKFIKL